MRKIIMTICVCGLVLMTTSPGWSQSNRDISTFYSKSWAVVIGINTYQNFPSLEYAVNDAKAIAARFQRMGFEVIALQDNQATKQGILDVLTQQLPAKVGKNDRLVIFYAGHGAAGVLPTGEEVGFIIPTDAKSVVDGRTLEIIGGKLVVDDYNTFADKANFISVEEIRDVSDTVQAKHILYIIDGCYSGFLDPAVYSRSHPSKRIGKDVQVAQQADTSRSLIIGEKGAQKPPPPSLPKADSTEYLHVIVSRDTVQVMTAGSSGEEVYEKAGHGLFTHYLLKALDGAADTPLGSESSVGDCVVTVTELGNYLKQKVPEASNFSQSPLFNRISGEGDFLFIPPKCQPLDPIDLQPPANDETWAKTEAYKGPKTSRYKAPMQVVVDQENHLYVLDTELNRIFKFDAQGNALPSDFSTQDVTKPWTPSSMALGYGGELWVYYSWHGTAKKKEAPPTGKLAIYHSDGTVAPGWNGTTEPLAACSQGDMTSVPFPAQGLITLDIEDNLVIVDQQNGVLTKCDRNGKLIQQWGKYAEHQEIENVNRYKTVTHPQGIAVDMLGYIYVADTDNHGIQKYFNGEWIPSWPNIKGDKPYFFNSPHGLAVDSKLYVYVADTQNHRIKKYTSGGEKLLTLWGKKDAKKGSNYGEFDLPTGVAVNWDSTLIYVADTGNKRVQKFLVTR
jgi:DNA-binding beta-propeller fold protein YncE